jgi:hypothetical protein
MNLGIETEVAEFHFWKYLLRIFGILSLQCSSNLVRKFAHFSRLYLFQCGSGTGMLRYRTEIQDARMPDVGGIDLDADAQLWWFCCRLIVPWSVALQSRQIQIRHSNSSYMSRRLTNRAMIMTIAVVYITNQRNFLKIKETAAHYNKRETNNSNNKQSDCSKFVRLNLQ